MKQIDRIYQYIINGNITASREDYHEIYHKLQSTNAKYKGKIVDFLYHPVFFSAQEMDHLSDITEKMTVIIRKCTEQYISDPEFRTYFKFSPEMEELILIDPGYKNPVPIARYDLFYGNDFKFCELNGDGTSAMNEANTLEKIFIESKIIAELTKKYDISYHELFTSWLKELLEIYSEFGGKGKPTIAIADFLGLGSNEEFDTFKLIFEQQGYKTIICDPREMKYQNGKLYVNDLKIDLIYRRAVNKEVETRISEVQELIQAYRDQAVCVVGPFRSQIMHNKIFFEILWNEKATDFLNKDEREFIKNHVPETFTLNEANFSKVARNKDKYVIKPKDNYAGKGVICGLDLPEPEWLEELKKLLLSGHSLIQKFSNFTSRKLPVVEKDQIRFEEFKTTLGLFIYNGKLKGLYSRVGRQNVIAGIVESITLPSFVYREK
jgi:glutathionylspermidine synthase